MGLDININLDCKKKVDNPEHWIYGNIIYLNEKDF